VPAPFHKKGGGGSGDGFREGGGLFDSSSLGPISRREVHSPEGEKGHDRKRATQRETGLLHPVKKAVGQLRRNLARLEGLAFREGTTGQSRPLGRRRQRPGKRCKGRTR